MGNIYFVSLLFVGLSFLVSMQLKSKFKRYSLRALAGGLSGAEVARLMLLQQGITNVKVTAVPGQLTDHYNPTTLTVNLSEEVFNGRSIAAAAVAAHECGHAVQHATGYTWLQMRSKLVPVVQFSSQIVQWVLLGGIVLINVFPQLLLGGVLLFALTTVFAVVTLPVEFDASQRALAWLQSAKITTAAEQADAKDALHWAAMTYVVAAVASIVTLLQYLLIYLSGRRNG